MTDRNDLARPRPDLAGRTGQNQPLDLATSPLPIGRRRRGELDERRTHTSHNDVAGEVNHDHEQQAADTPPAPGEIRRTARRLALIVALQPCARRRRLVAMLTEAVAGIDTEEIGR